MKIGIDTLFESPAFPTGATGYMTNILRCLAQIDKENEYFLFVSHANRHLYRVEQENFHYVTCWASNERRSFRIATQQLQSPGLVRKYGIDVFNSPGNTAPLLLPCASVLTIKTMHHYQFAKALGWRRAAFRRAMVRASARQATSVIANSESNRDEIVGLLTVPPEKVTIVYEAVDHECFRADLPDEIVQEQLRARGIRRPYLLNVSSFWPYKNQLELIGAYAQLVREQRIPHELVFVGGSDQPAYSSQIRAKVVELGLEDRIRFLGYLKHSELAYVYRGADVFVYPSLFETFGLTLLEAMACGVPVVCSNRGSLPEIAGGAALEVNPELTEEIAQSIWRVLSDENLRKSLVYKGLARANDFSWEKTAANTLGVFLRAGMARKNGATNGVGVGLRL
jgi:glycosyltransferase involved in cell wall biosynthesis